MSRDLAPEGRDLLAHPLLDERVSDPIHEGDPARGLHSVRDHAGGPHVVDDPGPPLAPAERFPQQRGHEIAGDELAAVVDEKAAVGVPVPGDAQIGPLLHHPLHDLAAVRLHEGIRGVVGEGPVGVEVHGDGLDGEAGQDGARADRGHPVARVEHDLEARHERPVDQSQAVLGVVLADFPGVEGRLGGGGGPGVAAGHHPLANLLDPLVSGEGQGALADQLDPVPLLGVVGGGHDRTALEAVAGHEVVEHVGAHDPEVGHRASLGPGSLDQAARDLGGGEPHVPAHRDVPGPQVVHEGAADLARHRAFDLRGVEPAHVVGLEDAAVDSARGHRRSPIPRSRHRGRPP